MGEKVSKTKRTAIKLLAKSHGVSYQTASAMYNGKQRDSFRGYWNMKARDLIRKESE